jgi:hypothetical protein
MQNDRKRLYIIMCSLSVAVVGLSIAYAALSQTLNISLGTVTQSPQSWNVAFVTGTVTATTSATSSTGFSCGDATVTAEAVTISSISLSKPDDTCKYALTIKNTGSIAAKLNTIARTKPSGVTCTENGASMVCGNITYSITTNEAGTTLLTTGGTLAANTGTLNVWLIAKYTGTTLNSSAVTHTNPSFALTYDQA